MVTKAIALPSTNSETITLRDVVGTYAVRRRLFDCLGSSSASIYSGGLYPKFDLLAVSMIYGCTQKNNALVFFPKYRFGLKDFFINR